MVHSDIKRSKFTTMVSEEVLMPSIQEEAVAVLGYKKPEPQQVVSDELGGVLAKLEIEILNWRDVLTYQVQQRHKREETLLSAALAPDQNLPSEWGRRFEAQWQCTPIEEYRGYVPDFALQKAIEIKKVLPRAQIIIEHLKDSPDPFMLVRTGDTWSDKGYYVEVWDEPGFENR
jgi:hypothetical protein